MNNFLLWCALSGILFARVLTGLCGAIGLIAMLIPGVSVTPAWFFAFVFIAMILSAVSNVKLIFSRSEA